MKNFILNEKNYEEISLFFKENTRCILIYHKSLLMKEEFLNYKKNIEQELKLENNLNKYLTIELDFNLKNRKLNKKLLNILKIDIEKIELPILVIKEQNQKIEIFKGVY